MSFVSWCSLLVAGMACVACGGESSDDGRVGDNISADGGGGSAGATGTGGAAGSGNVACMPIELPATEVVEELVIVEVLPSGMGGTLVDGEFELIAHTRYSLMPRADYTPTRMRAAARIRNGGTVIDYAFVEGSSLSGQEPDGFTAQIHADGATLALVTECPPSEAFDLTYTATASEFVIFEENEEFRFQPR
jgi:hypothetical protein